MRQTIPIRSRPERRFSFTTARLDNYNPPAVGRVELTDSKCPDLKLRVTSAGAKSFAVFKKLNGRPIRLTIGSFPSVSIDAARKRAREFVGDMIHGIDPREAKREARAAKTFGEVAADYVAASRKKSLAEDQRQLKTYLSSWSTRDMKSIRREHVAALHTKLGTENGKYCANRVLAMLATIFSFAIRVLEWSGTNPCKGVKPYPEEKRSRFLMPEEMPRFFAAVDASPHPNIRDLVYLSLLTGARQANVMAMKWRDLDLAGGTWTIAGSEAKAGKTLTLPLVPAVVEILRKRPRVGEYVFPGRHGHSHLRVPGWGWQKILAAAGIDNLRLHDLRRTFGSWQAGLGTSLPIIGASSGHRDLSVTAVYARLSLAPVRAAVTAATDAILEAGKAARK